MDSDGNIYFTDSVERSLYRLKRKSDNTLPRKGEEILLWGLGHAGGVSIDRENKVLYLGARTGCWLSPKAAILQIPLAVFDKPYKGCSYSSEEFTQALERQSLKRADVEHEVRPAESGLPLPKPNGVLFVPGENKVFYTHENLPGGISGREGYLGDISNSLCKRYVSPNGLDVDTTTGNPVLVIALTLKNSIVRFNLSTGESSPPVELKHETKYKRGLSPDGLICLKNGDILFASFISGRVYFMPWDGQAYGDPRSIADGLDCPTDLVVGTSSSGAGESLFVTTTKMGWAFLRGGGNIIEIPNICEKIDSHRNVK
jgi:hypothetical protein